MKRFSKFFFLIVILSITTFTVVKPTINASNSPQTITSNQSINSYEYIQMHAYATPVSPIIDGIKDNVWGDAGYQTLIFTNGTSSIPVNFYVLHDFNYLYFAFQYHDPTLVSPSSLDDAQVMIDMNTSATYWNQIQLGSHTAVDSFDVPTVGWNINNNTAVAFDRYSYNAEFAQDTSLGGTNDTFAGASYDSSTHTYFYELAQPMQDSDIKHDIQIQVYQHTLILPSVMINNQIFHYENFGNLTIEKGYFPHNVPVITFQSPSQDSTSFSSNVQVNFIVNLRSSWIGYSLDGRTNVTVNGDYMLKMLSDGNHSIVMYAKTYYGMVGKSTVLNFTVDTNPSEVNLMTIPVYSTSVSPVTDGIKDQVWNEAGYHILTLTNGIASIPVNFYVLHDSKNLYFAFQYHDPTFVSSSSLDDAQIMLDMNTTATIWNQFGSQTDTFDVLTAGWNLGTNTSVAFDRFSNGLSFNLDASAGGTNNTDAGASYNLSTQDYFYELSQPLNSTDNLHDISLEVGDHALALPSVLIDNSQYIFNKIANLYISPDNFSLHPITHVSSTITTSLSTPTTSASSSLNSSSSTSSSLPGFSVIAFFISILAILIRKRKKH